MIKEKIVPGTPDEICTQCAQMYEGECRAFNLPHSEEERESRTTGYGMECDPLHLRLLGSGQHGVKYHTWPKEVS